MNMLTIWLRRISLMILTLSTSLQLYAQQTKSLSIQEVYQSARKNYPLIRQRDLITKTKDYSVSNAAKGYLPVFSVNGQATYQSMVTSFPFNVPGITIPEFNKDQYKFYAEGNQVIYDGGIIKNQQQTAEANEGVQQQNLEVQLYALYDRVNQLFFGALLEDEQLKQNALLQQDLQNGIDKAKALVANGVAYRSSVDELSAQLLQAQQARIDLKATKKAFLNMLGLFINAKIDDNTVLEKPAAPTLTDSITRPELLVFDYQKKIYDLQEKLLHDRLKPKISFFVQGGYGRPGLNFLSNNFEGYYLGGLRLSWNFGSLYSLKNNQHLLEVNKNSLDIQKETFLFNTKISQLQQNENVQKYDSLLDKDNTIIELRTSVKKAAYAQLENGVLSAHDYITQVNAEDQARQTKILHEMQLLQARYSYENIVGNINIK
ncbi:MAG TPA: TolC family protein [Hanamia sp.]|nr:TolC family protein [Hanamia sp.]